MEPLSRSTLQTLRADMILQAKERVVDHVVSTIRSNVRSTALLGNSTKYVHILTPIVGHAGCIDSQLAKVNIHIDDIKEPLMKELRNKFPDCKVEYIERKPAPPMEDIFSSDPRFAVAPVRRKGNGDDGIDRAIVVDWS
jgi:hypothetical protein